MEEFKGLIEFMDKFNTNEKCREHLRQALYPVNPTCKCGKRMVYHKNKCLQGFRCYACKHSFALTHDTMFFKSIVPMRKWFIAIYLFTVHSNGISCAKLSRLIDVSPRTVWHMLHRIRISLQNTNLSKKLCGKIEADETYIGADRRRGGPIKQKRGRGSRDKIVFGAVERNGRAYGKVIPDCSGNSLKPIIYKKIRKRATLFTDGWNGYKGLKGFKHFRIKHKDSMLETRTIESFWNNVKSTIRTHRGVSLKHLQKYVNQIVFHYNFRKHHIFEAFNTIISNCFTTTTWRNLIDVPYVLD